MQESKKEEFEKPRIIRYYDWLKLCSNPDYYEVVFDSDTYGLQATHKDHRFDESRGHYEREVVTILYRNGHKVILKSEKKPEGIKTPDGTLNDLVFEIKSVEGTGKNNIKKKFNEELSQGCSHVVLYFPDPSVYNLHAVETGYKKYKGIIKKEALADMLEYIWIILNKQIIVFK